MSTVSWNLIQGKAEELQGKEFSFYSKSKQSHKRAKEKGESDNQYVHNKSMFSGWRKD